MANEANTIESSPEQELPIRYRTNKEMEIIKAPTVEKAILKYIEHTDNLNMNRKPVFMITLAERLVIGGKVDQALEFIKVADQLRVQLAIENGIANLNDIGISQIASKLQGIMDKPN